MRYFKFLFALFVVLCVAGCGREEIETVTAKLLTSPEKLMEIEPAAGHFMMDYMPVAENAAVPQRRKIKLNLPEAIASPIWVQNAVASENEHKPKIVVVIDDLGIDKEASRRVSALPGPLTLAWLPYASHLPEQTSYAHEHGHELMVHMPMEPLRSTADPGPNALLTGLSEDELLDRIRENLSEFDGYVGVNNHMGSAFTQERQGLETLMSELRKRDILYLDSRTIAGSIAEKTARAFNVATTGRDVFLDHIISTEFIEGALRRTEDHALEHGTAIAIGHPHDLTIKALQKWLPTLERKGFQLVPITAVMAERDPRIRHVGLIDLN